MDRNNVLWTLVLFFGASLMFAYIRDATQDESSATSLAAQGVAGVLLVVLIVLFLRSRR